jgi:hypothetical protein
MRQRLPGCYLKMTQYHNEMIPLAETLNMDIHACAHVDISPSSQPDRALFALNYGLTPNCNISQSRHGHTPITCAHTTGNSNTYLSQISYRNLLRSQ